MNMNLNLGDEHGARCTREMVVPCSSGVSPCPLIALEIRARGTLFCFWMPVAALAFSTRSQEGIQIRATNIEGDMVRWSLQIHLAKTSKTPVCYSTFIDPLHDRPP